MLTDSHRKALAELTQDITDARTKAAGWMKTATASHLRRTFPELTQADAETIVTEWAAEGDA